MRISKKLSLLSFLAFSSILTVGCSQKADSSTTNSANTDTSVHFVAVESTSWDATITIGTHKYQFDIALKDDKTINFAATCSGVVEKNNNQGGGFGPMGANDSVEETSSSAEVDLTKYNFSYDGTWSLEEGYGYVLNLKDSALSVIHTSYDTTQGRHQFYYLVTTDEGSVTTLFQYKDSGFRKSLAKDYKTWDERDSQYIFVAETAGNNNSIALSYLYFHKDNSVVYNYASGSSRKATLGMTWKLVDNVPVMVSGETEYTPDVALNGKGYRLAYNNYGFLCSTDSNVDSLSLKNADFDGATLYQFSGSYTTSGPDGGTKNVELNLTDNENKMFLYSNNSLSKKGTYTFENEVFTLNFDGEDPVSVNKNEEGNYVYTYQIQSSGFFGNSTTDVVLTYTPGV
jgi:hypothetical protein